MDWNLIIGIVAGIGTTIGTLAATEQYFSRKFIKAVKAAITELDIERNIRHLQNDYKGLAQQYSQSVGEFEEKMDRCKSANVRQHSEITFLKAHIEKLETAIRLLASEKDEKTLNAIFESSTVGSDRKC